MPKARKKRRQAYDQDPLHKMAIGAFFLTILVAGITGWTIVKLVGYPYSLILTIFVSVIAVIIIATIVATHDFYSKRLVDKYGLRCPKCGQSSVKSGGRRGPDDPEFGVSKCYHCGKEFS